jgi:hypothetical protein
MRASSIGLVIGALLTAASFHSAAAGATIVSSPRHFVSPTGMAHRPMEPSAAGRFGAVEAKVFRRERERDRRFPQEGDGGSFGPGPDGDQSAAGEGFLSAPGGSIGNIEINITLPRYPAAPMQAVSAVPGPRIITIGAQPHWAHAGKLPIIVYGTHGGVY